MPPFGVNLISTFGKPYSITYLAFSLADALIKRGVPISLCNVLLSENEDQILRQDLRPYMVPARLDAMKHPINLLVLPAKAVKEMMVLLSEHDEVQASRKMHVTNLWWELSKLPLEIEQDLKRFDVVLTHSDFLANLASTSAPQTHVINSPLSWRVDGAIKPDRARFQFPDGATVYLFVFDADSERFTVDAKTGNGRKNPLQLVDTFLRAFPAGQSDVHLAIRATHIEKPVHADLLNSLMGLVQRDPRIQLIQGDMGFTDVMTLTASCDVYTSLHRGEGFGLGMMEAMAFGKPVIATAWSGNMSFLDSTNACLVRYELEPLSEGYRYHGSQLPPGTLWAKPSQDDAIVYMRRLHRDKGFRDHLGQNARVSYKSYQAQAEREKWIDELFLHWKMFDTLPRITGKYSSTQMPA
jgi:glycosyltransferase involved in cell wall biosynthesis